MSAGAQEHVLRLERPPVRRQHPRTRVVLLEQQPLRRGDLVPDPGVDRGPDHGAQRARRLRPAGLGAQHALFGAAREAAVPKNREAGARAIETKGLQRDVAVPAAAQ